MVASEEIGRVALFASLAPAQRERLARASADITLLAGEYAANAGDDGALFAVLEGRIEPVRLVDGVERVLGERREGDVFGEVPIVLGTMFPVGFRAAEASRVMRLEAQDYYAVAAVVPEVGKEVGRLAAHRMGGARGLQGIAAETRPPRAILVGHRFDASCANLRRFLDRNQITFKWVTPDAPDAVEVWGGPLPPEEDWPAIRVVDGSTGDSLGKSMSRYLVDQIATRPNIRPLVRTELAAVQGEHSLEAIDVRDSATGATTRLESGGLFIFIGADAETGWLPPEIALNQRGYVLTGSDMRAAGRWPLDRDPYLLETSVPGIFACGDVRFGPVKRVAAAVGEGSMAIAFVHQFLRDEDATPISGSVPRARSS